MSSRRGAGGNDVVSEALRGVPIDNRRLRACLLCGLVKTAVQFKQDGCDNCDDILEIRGSSDRVLECTSSNFSGHFGANSSCVALMKPEESWAGRWQHIDKFNKGIYAIIVTGELPEDIQMILEQKGIEYRPRDQSFAI